MTAVNVEIPPSLTEAVTQTVGEEGVGRWALEALVFAGVADNPISTGEAAELLG